MNDRHTLGWDNGGQRRPKGVRVGTDHICEALGWPTSKERTPNSSPKLTVIDGDKEK